MKTKKSMQVICLVLAMAAVSLAAFENPPRMEVLVPTGHMTYDGLMGGTPSAFLYRASDDRFYTTTYGSNLGLRCFVGPEQYFPVYVENPLDRNTGKSWQCASESDLLRVASSTDIEGGLFYSGNPVSFYPGGLILNPAPVTYNGIDYAAGELAVLSAYGKAVDSNSVKRMLTWDFREIWSYTDKEPDYANAEWDSGTLMTDIFGSAYGYGRTNWNDCFTCLMSQQDVADALDLGPQAVNTNTDQVGSRQAAFSSDASKVYFVSMAAQKYGLSGLWSVELATKEVKRLFDNSDFLYAKTASEPTVLPIGVRNLTGVDYDPNFDQVLFNATDITGNVGGLVAMVDDGNEYPIYPVVDAEQILDFMEIEDPNYNDYSNFPKVYGVTVDDQANIYMYLSKPYVIIKYDVEGRMSAVSSRAMAHAFHRYEGYTSSSTTFYRIQNRTINVPLDEEDPNDPGLDITQIMYMSVGAKCVAGIDVYPTCDFDRDGEITIEDLKFFQTQIQKTWNDEVPMLADGQDYVDYLECDLNGITDLNSAKDGLEFACVTEKDIEILYQFVTPGDTNLDGVVDSTDLATVEANMGMTEGADWSHGDFDFDGDVDADDLALLMANMS